MNVESKNKWQIRLATLSIFVLGFAAGGFALNAYHLWSAAGRQPTRHELYEEAFNSLSLSDSQKIDVQRVIVETRDKIQKMKQDSEPRLQDIRANNDSELQKILSPEQWQKFQRKRDDIRQSD
jgi:hypothetical protein